MMHNPSISHASSPVPRPLAYLPLAHPGCPIWDSCHGVWSCTLSAQAQEATWVTHICTVLYELEESHVWCIDEAHRCSRDAVLCVALIERRSLYSRRAGWVVDTSGILHVYADSREQCA